MWVASGWLTIVGSICSAISQVDVMSVRQIVSLRSWESSASLDASWPGLEPLSLWVSSRSSKTTQRSLRVEWLCAGIGSWSTKAARPTVLIVSIGIGKGGALSEILLSEALKFRKNKTSKIEGQRSHPPNPPPWLPPCPWPWWCPCWRFCLVFWFLGLLKFKKDSTTISSFAGVSGAVNKNF